MTVTGTEQRVYGTLTGGCIINLHRFALVSGSTTLSPPEASTVTYADTTPYKQCGYKYAGYLTLFLSISGSSVYAAVEVRICKNDAKRIVIETYGEVAKTVTGGMALWFNKGNDTTPDWVLLNSTASGVIMPYATISYTFKESKRNGSTTIDCCKKCPSCGCKTCNITGLSLSYISPAVVEPTPLQWDANGRWTHLDPSSVETLSDTVTKYVYTTFERMVYQVIRTINWDQSTNITTTIFEASVVSAWLYYQCHFELRWRVGGTDAVPGGINPGGKVGGDPPMFYVINPYYGSTTGEILIGTDVRSGYSGTVTPSSTSSYGYTNNGDYTAFFASQKSFIEYKLKCDSLQFWIGDTGPHNSQNKLYYTDMDTGEVHLLGTLEPGQAAGTITTSFPFDYLKNCIGSHTASICKNLATSLSPAITSSESSCAVGRTVEISNNCYSGKYQATISAIDKTANTMTFSNIVFAGTGSDQLSDRSYSVSVTSAKYTGTIYNGWMGNTYFGDRQIGYVGPVIGFDIFVVCDFDITITNGANTSFNIVICGLGYTGDSSSISVTLDSNGYASGTTIPSGYYGSYSYPAKQTIYVTVYGGNMNIGYGVTLNISNVRAVNCRGEPYVAEDIIPVGKGTPTITYI